MSVDPITGDVNVAFYDTRNDTHRLPLSNRLLSGPISRMAASRFQARTFVLVRQARMSTTATASFPCLGINYGNQQGDYEGLVSFGGASYPSLDR